VFGRDGGCSRPSFTQAGIISTSLDRQAKTEPGDRINLDLIEDSGGYSAGLGVAGYLRGSELL